MSSPVVSVIIPVYNREDYLAQALDSVLAQTLQDIEVICVDNGSTDASPEILRRYEATSPVAFKVLAQGHAGPGAARNAGLDVASGEYICFLDSDDFLEPYALEHAVARARTLDAQIVIWDLWQYDNVLGRDQYPPVGTLTFDAFVPYDEQATRAFCAQDNPDKIFTVFQNWPWNKLFRRDFLEAHALRFPAMYRTEDCPFVCMALAQAQRMAVLYERLSHYRIRTGTSAMDVKDAHPTDFIDAFVLLRAQLQDAGLYEAYRHSYQAWALGAAVVNLNTLHDGATFERVFSLLRDGGFAQLDLAEEIDNPIWPHEIEAWRRIMSGTPAAYLLWHTNNLEAGFADHHAQMDVLHAELRGRDAKIDELEMAVANERARAETAERELAELRREHEALLSSAEWRSGKALCKLPRAIQRRIG